MRKYKVYFDNGKSVAVPAENVEEARERIKKWGTVVDVKDITNSFTISIERLYPTLIKAGLHPDTIDIIIFSLIDHDLCR